MELVFCTNNQHKLKEVGEILGTSFSYLTLNDIGYFDDIPEPYETLAENSFTKANQVFQQTGKNCFSEDTGLFIEALNAEPGVYSARYAGEHSNAQNNMDKVLLKLKDVENRNAYFKTVVTLILNGEKIQFDGICNGVIALNQSGVEGFGYDPIFIPEGHDVTFAEITSSEKNAISHRKKAFDKLAEYLLSISK